MPAGIVASPAHFLISKLLNADGLELQRTTKQRAESALDLPALADVVSVDAMQRHGVAALLVAGRCTASLAVSGNVT